MIDCTAGEGENLVHTLAAPFLACPPKSVGGEEGRDIPACFTSAGILTHMVVLKFQRNVVSDKFLIIQKLVFLTCANRSLKNIS